MTAALLNDISVAEDIMFEAELGPRVFRCMTAENDPPNQFIQGISDLFFLTDPHEDWSDITWMIHDDRKSDFKLETGVALIVQHMTDKEAALKVLQAWEKQEPIDWQYEELVRQITWEEWVTAGGLDDEGRVI